MSFKRLNKARLVTWAIGLIASAAAARGMDETARFNGTWKTEVPYNGQSITIASVHADNDYQNYSLPPQGSFPIGSGTFTAVDGRWAYISAQGNDSGTYEFTDQNTATFKTDAGVTVVWRRDNSPLPAVIGAPANAPPPNQIPAADPNPQVRAEIEAKMAARDYEGALILLGQNRAQVSPNPFLCITGAKVMMQMENYKNARGMTAFFLQHTFDNADAYVVHAQACAAMGDQRWADIDLKLAAQIRPDTADADRKSVEPYTALSPRGFSADELPGKLADLVKMAAAGQPFQTLVDQAVRIIKGENNIRRAEGDNYRERKRQLVAGALANPHQARPLVDLATFLYQQSCDIHGDGREGYKIAAYRWFEPTLERQLAIAYAGAALKNDPGNVQAMSCEAGALMAMGDEDQARPIVTAALSINSADPELLHMFCQLMTRSSNTHANAGDQLSMPMTWEDDHYFYIQSRSPEDLAQARGLYQTANDESNAADNAIQAAINNTRGTAAGFYYQAVQCRRNSDTAGGAAAMEKAIQLAPDNVEYRDLLAYFYGNMGWRRETDFFTQWSTADNLGETSAAKMIRLAYQQLRRGEYDAARPSIESAMQIDPADARGPAYMGCLIAGENKSGARADEAAAWLMAASALAAAQQRIAGFKHVTPNIQYTPNITGLELGVASAAGEQLLRVNRPRDAAVILRDAIDDGNRVGKAMWTYPVPQAMLPIPSLQGTTVPHMNPLKAPPVCDMNTWMIHLHELAGQALRDAGQSDQASQEESAAQELKQEQEDARHNASPPPMRR